MLRKAATPQAPNSAFRKPTSKAALWITTSAPGHKFQQLVGDRLEQRLVGQEFVGDAVHPHGVGVAGAQRVDVVVQAPPEAGG
jgi:hypothetical protein